MNRVQNSGQENWAGTPAHNHPRTISSLKTIWARGSLPELTYTSFSDVSQNSGCRQVSWIGLHALITMLCLSLEFNSALGIFYAILLSVHATFGNLPNSGLNPPGLFECLKRWTDHWRIDAFVIVVLEKTLESPLDSKEIKPVNSKGNQSWLFTGRTDAEVEAPLATWYEESIHWKRSWCWERLRAGEEVGNRVWDGWMTSTSVDIITDSMDMSLSKH